MFPASLLYPGALFRVPGGRKTLCLTFDDGPHPESTINILGVLRKYGVRATFFCTGQAATSYPAIVKEITVNGHDIGNHGFLHSDGWETKKEDYLKNAELADHLTSSVLFRPPYGRMTLAQYKSLIVKYRVVMWDVMPRDYDSRVGLNSIVSTLKKRVSPGSVIVLHDKPSAQAWKVADAFIPWCLEEGFSFGRL
jgi:peptidoglycan-N-acetylglucosamine deacetylase